MQFVSILIQQLLMIAVCLLGIGVALVRRHQAPGASLFCLLGFSLQLLLILSSPLVHLIVFQWWGGNDPARLIWLISLPTSCLSALATLLLLLAVFSNRESRSPTNSQEVQ